MKELSIEEKAQAYDKVVNKLKGFMAQGVDPLITRADVQDFFPELAESEDERIRKALIKLVKKDGEGYENVIDGVSIENAISWLEKQGEHANFRNKIQIGDKVTRNEDGILINLSQLNRVAKKDEKQGEQKPAKNIVETWKDMRLEVYQQASGNRHEPNCSDDTTKMFSLNDIDEIVEKMSEQSSTNKVEPKFKVGDVIRLKGTVAEYIIKKVTDTTYYTDGWSCGIERCEEDYELVEQKSWSEEDENLLKLSIENLTELKDRFGEEYGKVGDCIVLLESIKDRFTWKPSEEQMEALKSSTYCQNKQMSKVLFELYQQLKKLRKE